MVIFCIIIMLLVLLEQGYRKDYKCVCIVRFGGQIPEIFVKIRQFAMSVGIFACLTKVPDFRFWPPACDFLPVPASKFTKIGRRSGTLIRQTRVGTSIPRMLTNAGF